MEKINNVSNISVVIKKTVGGSRNIEYCIKENEGSEICVWVKLPKYNRPKKSDEIIDESNSFVNGFKVVKTSNGEYAYVREDDNSLLPFRYDIACNFNEFGFAMVGKDGTVSWIDKNFKYLNHWGNMVEEKLDKTWFEFDGWQSISDFSGGDIPLSCVHQGVDTKTSYFGTDGKIKVFYRYYSELGILLCPKKSFGSGSMFDEKGRATTDGDILFAKGYYVSSKDLLNLCMETGLTDSIIKEVDKCLEKENQKVFKKLK